MARKYIKQIINQNFIFPNDDVSEYDVEIVHDINNNSVSGTVANLAIVSGSSSSITFTYDWTFTLNGAEPFIRQDGFISVLSVHMLAQGQNYFKPWRLVDEIKDANTNPVSLSGTGHSVTVTASSVGLTSFTNGTYYFEFRFIGHRAIFPVCGQLTVSTIPTPTPTPTATPGPTSTPTPTPTATTPLNYTTGATINVTDTGYIKYNMSSGQTYQYIGSIGNVVLTNCLDCTTIREGIPFADLAIFTIVNCGSSCTPGPTATPAPTPTPDPECTSTEWMINNGANSYDVYWSGQNCNGNSIGGTVGAFTIGYTGCVKDGTLTYTGFPYVTVSGYC